MYQFSCNGLFDPNITGTGTQPLYFDQMMTFYNHYYVDKSWMEVEIRGSTASKDLLVVGYVDDDTTTSGIVSAMQRPGAISFTCNPGVSMPCPKLKLAWNADKTFGATTASNPSFRGNATTNPEEESYYTIQISDSGLGSFDLPVKVRIWYSCIFTEFKTVAAS